MAKKKSKKKIVKPKKKVEEKEKPSDFNKTLRNILVISAFIILIIGVSVFWNSTARGFEYQGVDYKVVEFCDSGPASCLITYNTKLPVTYEGQKANYNFYLRNDPRKLEKEVPFNGNLTLRDNLQLDITYGKTCNGYSNIAIQNLATLIDVSGINITEEGENATCDVLGKDMFILIQEGNETSIEQIGPACYTININQCEILEGTERFMNEMFVYLNENII